MRKLRHFQSLHDVVLFLHILGVWCLLPVILLLPLERAIRLLTPGKKTHSLQHLPHLTRQQKIMTFINYWFTRQIIASHNTCLKRSLVLYYFLNRYAIPVRFCLGIRCDKNGELEGHSWIEECETNPGFSVIWAFPE